MRQRERERQLENIRSNNNDMRRVGVSVNCYFFEYKGVALPLFVMANSNKILEGGRVETTGL